MKKSLIALAVLTASGISFAQSSVTIWGVVDAAVSRGQSDLNSVTRLVGSGISSSQLGFRGTEDLGGGMGAHFWLEASIGNDTGSGGSTNTNNQGAGNTTASNGTQGLTFARRSTVSLTGGFGEIRLGRDYTPQFWNLTAYDPFGTNGVGTTRTNASSISLDPSVGGTSGTGIRASNSVTYLYNHGKNATYAAGGQGLHAAVQMYFGENVSAVAAPAVATPKDGDGSAIRVGYNAGPLSVAIANGQTKFATGNLTMTNLGASYNFGPATAMVQLTKDELGAAKGEGSLLGFAVPMGAGLIRGSYSTYELTTGTMASSKQTAIGYVHSLSKRTRAYVTYATVSNSNGAKVALGGATGVADKSSSGFDIGMTHSF